LVVAPTAPMHGTMPSKQWKPALIPIVVQSQSKVQFGHVLEAQCVVVLAVTIVQWTKLGILVK
jgi:hypothetical protein